MRAKTLSVVLLAVLGLPAVAQATDAPQASVQFGVQSFRWREFGDTGERLLQEKGARFSIGAAFDNFRREDSGVLYGINGKIYLGSVDYDGQTQSGTPATSDVAYVGLNIEAQGGYRIGQRIGLDVFGALGMISYWLIYYHPRKTWLQMPIMTVGLISGTVANLLLIPRFGVMGAAMAMFLSSALVQAAQFFIGLRCTPIPFDMKKIGLLFGALIAETALLYLLYSFKLHWSIEISVKFAMLSAFVLGLLISKIVLLKDIGEIWIYLAGRVRHLRG